MAPPRETSGQQKTQTSSYIRKTSIYSPGAADYAGLEIIGFWRRPRYRRRYFVRKVTITHQIEDIFEFRDCRFTLAGVSEGSALLFDIKSTGIRPDFLHTACYRGYQCVYAVESGKLILRSLHVFIEQPHRNIHRLFGVESSELEQADQNSWTASFNLHFYNVNQCLFYTGSLWIGDQFIESLYRHMGFHPPYKYELVYRLTFEHGVLVSEADASQDMEVIRREMQSAAITQSAPSIWQLLKSLWRSIPASFDRTFSDKDK